MLVTEQGMVKVADFGTSRFLEIAAHGTTVIGSPPYMAPEQFQGKAVFASDIYSLGVTMYQMFTGVLPYNTPMPADLEKLMSGRAGHAAEAEEPEAAEGDQRHRDEGDRRRTSRRAISAPSDLLDAVLGARTPAPVDDQAAVAARAGRRATAPSEEVQDIQARLKARETVQAQFCWKCGKALPARADACPFCSERQ